MTSRPRLARPAVDRFLSDFDRAFASGSAGRPSSRGDNNRRAGRAYMRALVSPGGRKSMEPLSRRAGLDPNVFQNYISDAPWSDDEVQRINIRKLHKEKLASPDALIVVDDTGFPKKGDLSPGVARQYSGTMAKIDNCQLAVAAFYIVPGTKKNKNALRWPLGGRLYLPKHW